jgi:hypothetical protein
MHEVIHELHQKLLNLVILNIVFEKASYKVNRYFLQKTLRMNVFSDEWHALIHNSDSGGNVAIKISDDVGRYF